ncbi:SDR family NAD(P)-dependent oxidoreductase [Albibacterium indicum]|uniref:SDR family NAD(P)-dependent oxidoreductase n=1 Tax=Albibacterium indicum TaxID=2292082 RepID=UPI000E4816E9|nr:SDR family oxidoreductase [Pedobacter indicus]
MAHALITGASKGIGKAIAIELASRGYDILLVARSEKDLLKASKDIKSKADVEVVYLSIDLSLPDAPNEVYSWLHSLQVKVSVLVNNAGYGLSGRFETQEVAAIQNMMQLNMINLVTLTYLILPELKQNPASYILNVASTSAYQPTPNLAAYAASKAFVLSFSRALNHEYRGTGISVTCVSPGPTNTAFVERAQLTEKGLERMKKVHMQPAAVAKSAVRAMLARKAEVIPGLTNKVASFMTWLFPKTIVEHIAGRIIGNVIE